MRTTNKKLNTKNRALLLNNLTSRNEGCYELDPPRPRPLQKKHVLLVTFALLLLFSPKTEASFDLEKVSALLLVEG